MPYRIDGLYYKPLLFMDVNPSSARAEVNQVSRVHSRRSRAPRGGARRRLRPVSKRSPARRTRTPLRPRPAKHSSRQLAAAGRQRESTEPGGSSRSERRGARLATHAPGPSTLGWAYRRDSQKYLHLKVMLSRRSALACGMMAFTWRLCHAPWLAAPCSRSRALARSSSSRALTVKRERAHTPSSPGRRASPRL